MQKAFVVLVLSWLCVAAPDKPRSGKPFVTLAGAHSRIDAVEYHRIATEKELGTVWLRHVGVDLAQHSDYYNRAGVPAVDFERCMVVAVFGGATANSAGIDPVSVVEEKDRVVVRFSHRSYQTESKADSATPFGFFVVARSTKPLVLEQSFPNMRGDPPRIEERKRFPGPGK